MFATSGAGADPVAQRHHQRHHAAGFTASAAASESCDEDGRRLSVPAFMAHRNPSKQLQYAKPAAGKGKKGRTGMFQSKLCWR
jgi:hypothetical protein